jgi:hypothetical protein
MYTSDYIPDSYEEYSSEEQEFGYDGKFLSNYDLSSERNPRFSYVKLDSKQIVSDTEPIISKDIMKLIDRIFISNYCDKRKGNAVLVDTNQILKWIHHFDNTKYENFKVKRDEPNYAYGYNGKNDVCSNLKEIYELILLDRRIIFDILVLGDGKISLCGGSLIALINHRYNHGDWDLFFHCETIDEADKLLNSCLLLIENNNPNANITHFKNQRVHTVEYEDITIQFIKRVYKSKDQVLLGFDLAPSRIGYNPIDGLYATICGGLSIAMKCFPLDTTQRSMSFGYRLSKYMAKGFKILYPGLPQNFKEYINTPDGTLQCYDNDITFRCKNEFESDYADNPSDYLNWFYISSEKYHLITFEGDLNDVTELNDEFVKKSISNHELFKINNYNINTINVKSYKLFLGDQYKDFIDTYIINGNEKKACQIWQEKSKWYIEKGIEAAKLCKENYWKIENPGSQSFGKFNPILEHPKLWYGDNYQSVQVGIKTPQFKTFLNCLRNISSTTIDNATFNIPEEIINLIFDFWLEAEVNLARDYLLSLH